MKMAKRTAARPKPARARRNAELLADDACPVCGTSMVERRGTLRFPVNGDEIPVPSAVHLRCPKCHEVVLRAQDARRLSQDAIMIYRRKHGLLSADQIRAIREQFRLTQAEFARLLRLGGNTLSRWEAGRNVQTESMDTLLRLIRDVPGTIDYLRTHAA